MKAFPTVGQYSTREKVRLLVVCLIVGLFCVPNCWFVLPGGHAMIGYKQEAHHAAILHGVRAKNKVKAACVGLTDHLCT